MALKTGLEGKPWYVGLGVGVVVSAVLLGLANWQIFSKQKDEIAAKDAKLTELQTKIQEGLAAKQQLQQFREEVRQLDLELDKLLRILPPRRNTPELLRRIRSLAEQGNFDLKRFTPSPTLQNKDFYSEWKIAVSVEGTYHNLALFFDRISHFSRIINIENLTISAVSQKKAAAHTIAANFNAKTFVKEPERPPGEDDEDEKAAKDGKGKKGKSKKGKGKKT